MKSGKLVLAGIASVMLVSAAAIPTLAQQSSGNTSPDPNGRIGAIMKMFDADGNGQISRDEANTEKAKIFAEIDKNGDKKLSYDEVKAWAQDMLRKLPQPPQDDAAGNPSPPPPAQNSDQGNAAPNGQTPSRGPGSMMANGQGQGRPGWGLDRDDGPGGQWGGPGMMRYGMMHGEFGRHGDRHGFDHHRPDARTRLAMMFLRADANDDGFISQDEFNVMADRMFTHFDRNGDDVIDRQDMPRHHRPMGGWFGHGPVNWSQED